MIRHPATQGRADSNHRAIADAIRLLGYPGMDLSHAGNGVEDLLVGARVPSAKPWPSGYWLLVECKVARYKLTASTAVRYTKAQIEWRKQTQGWPRIIATSAQNAVDQIRTLTGSPTKSASSAPCSPVPRPMRNGPKA
ncbi:MAG: hypothetical protein A2V88_15220 [Elusimicrobia bacterium RBG_16_66_12]|nr:MAG: hypothetical protein A2V88_15220 [Elusimicrobia bacterium RBG_16_66_12]